MQSVREAGDVQLWALDDGHCMGSISLQTQVSAIIKGSIWITQYLFFPNHKYINLCMTLLQVTSMACCLVAQYVVVGTATGDVLFVEMTTKEKPRLVHRVHFYHVPIDHLVWVSHLLSYFFWEMWTECWAYCIIYICSTGLIKVATS